MHDKSLDILSINETWYVSDHGSVDNIAIQLKG